MSPVLGECSGSAAAVVFVHDDGEAAAELLERSVLSAFRHLGLPYRLLRVDAGLSEAELEAVAERHPLAFFPQPGTAGRLSLGCAERLARAVADGLGLVAYEPDCGSLPAPFRRLFGLRGETPAGAASELVVSRNDHYVTWLKEPGERVASDSPVEIALMPAAAGSTITDGQGHDLLLLAESGKGRAALFPFSSSLFCMDRVGHAAGLDDVFLRSLVWAARKPFAVWGMPPMAGLAVDDCSGSYDFFGYVDAMGERGWKPYLSLFTETIDEVAHEDTEICARFLRRGWEEGRLEIGFHALRYNESFCFDHLGRRPLSEAELGDRFERWDACLARLGVRHSPWAHPHFGEIGAAAIPYLRARGIEFLTYLLPLDAAWFDVPARVAPLPPLPPYGHGGYYHLDLPGFPGITALNCVLDRKSRRSAAYVPKTDYLWNNTVFWRENDRVDIGSAARTLAEQIRRGVDSGFYGQGSTHEQRLAVLRPGEIRELYAEADRLLERYELDRRIMSECMRYSRRRRSSALCELDWDPAGRRLSYGFSSEEAAGTELQLYVDGPDGRPSSRRVAVCGRRGSASA